MQVAGLVRGSDSHEYKDQRQTEEQAVTINHANRSDIKNETTAKTTKQENNN